ncbi:MAG: fibro-slime domain-containing protein [Phycisphaeraceae bacterium]
MCERKRAPKKLIVTALAAAATLLGGLPASQVMADTLEMSGVIRDFKRGDQSGGHADFETAGAMGRFGHVIGMVTMDLGSDGKPVYSSSRPDKDTMHGSSKFAQWYKDVPNVNIAIPLTIALSNGKSEPGGVYSYASNSFWPIDGKGFGNQGLNRNFHFTFELHNTFTYRPGQNFTFIGDDDVWVYIAKKKVIDLGGVHSAETSSVLLFDGKAFVTKGNFTLGGDVKSVSSSMATSLAQKWSDLAMSGSSPIKSGDYYIDLDLNAGLCDIAASFTDHSATVRGTKNLTAVTLRYIDGTVQKFDNLNVGKAATFTGTGAYAAKTLIGAYIKTSDDTSANGRYRGADNSGGIDANLDFFFAERHTTQSNFRIDTSMTLKPTLNNTISPLYD